MELIGSIARSYYEAGLRALNKAAIGHQPPASLSSIQQPSVIPVIEWVIYCFMVSCLLTLAYRLVGMVLWPIHCLLSIAFAARMMSVAIDTNIIAWMRTLFVE
jgi:hypothetical protein